MSVLSPGQRVAQLFVPRVDVTDNAADRAKLRSLIEKYHLGGILLGKGTIRDYSAMINLAQEVTRVPMLITLDGEWGLAMRVTDAPRFPYNMGLGAISDPQLLYDYGKEVGRECRAIGIQVDFAPVLDVNSNPDNPVIGYRSFGEDAEHVAELGVAFARGMESEGIMSVAKHFPGHGDTSTDSHKTLSKVTHSRKELDQTDLLPFRKYIEAGLSGVMVGHLDVPALDGSGTPASMSAKITSNLLKKQMHFRGLVFTDGLSMKGAVLKGRNNCVAALQAGADVLLGSADLSADIEAVNKAVKSGDISQSLIDERCHKLLYYKYLLGLTHFVPSDPATVKSIIDSPQARSVISSLADASMTVLYNRGGVLPLRELGSRSISVVCIGASSDCDFARYCLKYAPAQVVSVTGKEITSEQLAQLTDADIVITAVMSDAKWAKSSFSKLRSLKGFVPVFFMNPYRMSKFGDLRELPTLVTAYDNMPALQRAASEALFGGIDVNGRFPVNVANVAPLGTGVDLAKCRLGYSTPASEGFNPDLSYEIDSIVEACIKAKAFSGCQVLVARDGQIVIDRAYGRIDFGASAPQVTDGTLFDLASVSKAAGTLPGLMKAYDEGLYDITDEIGQYIPGFDSTDKGGITIRDLLFHESGMPPVINIYSLVMEPGSYSGRVVSSIGKEPYTVKISDGQYGNSQARMRTDIYSDVRSESTDYAVARDIYVGTAGIDSLMEAVYRAPLRSRKYEYSCLNFMLLKQIQENLTGVDMDQWVETEIFGPLGAWHTLYQPLDLFDEAQIAATEKDNYLRRQHIHGYVHDEMAAFSGGVQGNAGLFANACDIAKLCQMWLNGGVYGGERILSESTVKLFTGTHSRSGMRGLGFDMLKRNKSMDSARAASSTYGHTGFTGTCFWVDPERDIIFVFLSNRVNPTRDNSAWNRMNPRGAILRAVYAALS
ncbi:MAG: serine hydrolase [Muribaculaceae bacterium]|nr:serine hydrolase [Muribaculaceae bacterium]